MKVIVLKSVNYSVNKRMVQRFNPGDTIEIPKDIADGLIKERYVKAVVETPEAEKPAPLPAGTVNSFIEIETKAIAEAPVNKAVETKPEEKVSFVRRITGKGKK